MLLHPTLDKLQELRLTGMRKALLTQLEQPDPFGGMTFEDRLGLLIDRERDERDQRALTYRLQLAKIPMQACLEDVDFRKDRGLTRELLATLTEGKWIRERLHILISGPTGVGKTFLACALAHHACRSGYKAFYARLSRLLEDLNLARHDGRYSRLMQHLSRVHVLLLDDFGHVPLTLENRRDLLEILVERENHGSIIMTSQFPLANWHGLVGDPTLADAILDRLIHRAYRLELKGESMRKTHPPGPKTSPDLPS